MEIVFVSAGLEVVIRTANIDCPPNLWTAEIKKRFIGAFYEQFVLTSIQGRCS